MPAASVRSLCVLAAFMLAAAAAAAFGGYFTAKVVITELYAGFLKPAWAPPAWVFGPVWTCLYVCMSCSAWLVWKQAAQQPVLVRPALTMWWCQLALNAGWPVVFYLQPAGFASAFVCGILACLVFVCCCVFFRCSRLAAVLMVPYFLWLILATALSFSLWTLNS